MRRVLPVLALVCTVLGSLVAPAGAATGSTAPPSLDYTPSHEWWGTNGRVNDIAVVGGRTYLAGGFDYVGPTTGYGAAVDGSSGRRTGAGPLVDGVVRSSAPDGQGGFYLVGDFVSVGGVARRGAAQVSSTGALTRWNPKVVGRVEAVVVTSSGVVLGGSFSAVGDAAASNLAAVDPVRGARSAGWTATASAPVHALATAGDRVYVGGDFTSISGVSRSRLARLGPDGTLDQTFAAGTNGPVAALAVDPERGVVHVGGSFTAAGTGGSLTPRSRLSSFAVAGGSLLPAAPVLDGAVQALAVDRASGDLFAGGLFGSVSGVTRARFAQLTPSGAVGPLDAGLDGCHARHVLKDSNSLTACTPEVSALAVQGGTVYVGGRFSSAQGVQRHDAVALDLSAGGIGPWDPVPGDRPLTISASGGRVFLGGDFTSLGGLVRRGLAALDTTTGVGIEAFRADADEFVAALEPSPDGRVLYVAGTFSALQGLPRTSLAAVDVASGKVVPTFRPSLDNKVLSLATSGRSLFVGGKFTRVDRQVRVHAAKLDGTTGAVDARWVADTDGPSGPLRSDGMVMGVEASPDGSTVFLAGPFTSVNANAVAGGIAVVDGATGAFGARQLGGVRRCSGIGPWINRLTLSDDGRRLYGGDVCPDDVYQWDAVTLSSAANPTGLLWRTSCNGGMQGRFEVNGHFYYGTHGGDKGNGGRCLDRPGGTWVSQQRFFVFDAADGRLLPDAPEFDTPMGVWSYAATPAGLLVGGDFTFAGSRRNTQQGLAFFPGRP